MPTIGEQLKQAREARRLSIQQVVQAIRIRSYYLEAMEADDFSSMPSAVQARGFLRSYAGFLGLDADELIDSRRKSSAPEPVPAEETAPETDEPAAPEPEPAVEAGPPLTEDEAQLPEPDAAEEALPEPEPAQPEALPALEPAPLPVISHMIFVEIGNQLRRRRELLSLTLDEIERHTRVRKHYLSVIEAGNYDELPSPVQARGMLSNYASFLDLDAEAILLRFADALQARRLERQPASPARSGMPRVRFMLPVWLRRFISPDLLIGGGMVLLLFFLTLWGAVRIFSGGTAQPTQTQGPSISDVLLASPVASLEATNVLPTSLVTEAPDAGGPAISLITDTPAAGEAASAVEVTISVLERTYIRVVVDGEVKLEGRVAPGAAQTFDGQERIEILTGSGSAVQVLFNQRNLGVMGGFGEVVDRIYTLNGVETPTPTPSATVTETPRFQKSPTPTPTATSTRTPTRTPTVQQ